MAKRPDKPRPPLPQKDQALWDKITESVTPLAARGDAPAIKPRKMITRLDDARPLDDGWFTGVNTPAPNAGIDRKTKRRIATGRLEVDRAVDLHGLSQDQAYRTLQRVIEGAVRRGDKTLLVVTGKGGKRFSQTGGDTPVAYRTREDFHHHGGTLKRMVPEWLASESLRIFVESYAPAAKEHGGEGALYVRLRRRIPGSRKKTP